MYKQSKPATRKQNEPKSRHMCFLDESLDVSPRLFGDLRRNIGKGVTWLGRKRFDDSGWEWSIDELIKEFRSAKWRNCVRS
jgi:hypothetical protein